MNQLSESQLRAKQIQDFQDFIEKLEDLMTKANNSKSYYQDIVKIVEENFKKYGYPFLFAVFMELQEYLKDQFQTSLEQVFLKLQNSNKQTKPLSLHGLLNQLRSKNVLQAKKSNEIQIIWMMNQRSKKFILEVSKPIFKAALQIDLIQASPTTIKQIFLNGASTIRKIWPQNIFEQKTLNHLKQVLQFSYKRRLKEQTLIHCCSIFLGRSESFFKKQSKHHQHKNYHWPIQLVSMVKHVKKTIVGFLNLEGGIIYVGMKQNIKNVQSAGVFLTKQEVVKFFQWVHQLCETIYPSLSKHNNGESEKIYREDLENLKNRESLEKKSHFAVNNCVAIEYLSMIDKKTYLDIYEETPQNFKRLYLIRIKIKPGIKLQTYHLLKDDKEKSGQIQCFQRNDASVNKLSLEGFFKLYNQRILQFMNEDVNKETKENSCPQVHFDF